MPRLANARRIKKHWNYEVADAADALGVHRNTVRHWIKNGLPIVGERKPFLILGSDLKAFLDRRNASRKQPLKSGELYCVACHAPKRPAGAMVDFVPSSPVSGTLIGICPDCDRLIRRHVARTSLDDATIGLAVTITGDDETLRDLTPSLVNRNFSRGKN